MSKKNVVTGVIGAIVIAVLWYFFLPAFNLRSVGFWLMILVDALIVAVAMFPFEDDDGIHFVPMKIACIIAGIAILVLLIGGITTWKLFNVDRYREIITINTETSFEKDFPDIQNDSNIACVDLNTARKLGDRAIGNIKHASWYEVNQEYNLIKYNGEYYRLSPLEYAGIFKWHRAKYEGIPGYVLVNAKTQATEFVEVEGGFYYSPSAFWGKDLTRHLRGQYPTYIFGNSYFEIDEEGHPYWITAVDTPTIGLYGGAKETSFIVTDAVNGKSQEYNVTDLPSWIDHAYGLDYLMENINNYYGLVNGVFNFSKTDVYKTSYEYRTSKDDDGEPFAGYNSYVDAEGNVCFYTGLTPANKAESNTGFLSINPRTGEVKEYRYDMSGGIEEGTAIERAESEVQNFKYVSTFPMLVNVANKPTYLMILKGKDGLIKQYSLAMVSTESSVIVTGNDLNEAISNYKDALNKSGIDIDTTEVVDEDETLSITGSITSKLEVTIDGTTHYLYQLDNKSILYDSNIKTGYSQATLVVGDRITIEYVISDDAEVCTVISITKK